VAERDLRRKLFWLISIRVGISTLLLGSAIFAQLAAPGTVAGEPLFLLIGATYGLNILWTLTLKWAQRFNWLVDLQLASDALVVSGFIAVTGGITSYFAALYVLPIAAASSVQFRRGGMMIATLSAVLYLGIVLVQYFQLAGLLGFPFLGHEGALPPPRIVAYTTGLNASCSSRLRFSRIARRPSPARGRATRTRVERDCRSAGVQPARHRQSDERARDHGSTGPHSHLQPRRRVHYGHTALSVVGRRIEEVLDLAGERRLERRGGRRAASTGVESPYRTGDGRRIELGFMATELRAPGGNAGLLFAFQDVTDIKKLERDARLRQRLAAVGEMAAGIAHEIRNPLASMSGSIQILRQELPLTDDQAQLMDIVLRESERLNDTIRSFLAYARPQRFSIVRLDVRRVLNDACCCGTARKFDGHHRGGAQREVKERSKPTRTRSTDRLNLATNGLRAMQWRPADARRANGGGGTPVVVVDVRTKAGIRRRSSTLFQPSRAFSDGTFGSIVHRIVSDYGGEIHVSSTLAGHDRVASLGKAVAAKVGVARKTKKGTKTKKVAE
jgi:two-component system sensor histidine kinase PilS (NtrC family)